MDILMLNDAEVRRLLDPEALLDQLSEGFRAQSSGLVDAPKRIGVSVPNTGLLLAMPAYQQSREVTVKLVTLFHENKRLGLPVHQALICLFSPETGTPLSFMDGTYITALRTAGAAALSTRLLARTDARVLAIIGAGVQGHAHLLMLPHARPFSEIRLASRHFAHAEQLATIDARAHAVEVAEEAVRGADVVCLCTNATEPVISLDWLAPGMHITSVGYAPPGGELDRRVIAEARLFVETRQAFEPPPAGCAELAGLDSSLGTELGEVLLGLGQGRQSTDELTVYKAMGHACEDMAAANLVYHRAKQEGVGRSVAL
ncbi:ornithine cyclodeaminase family protein [Ktedonobacter racemifer]|uniref:Ornithine cyclodeaminase n=1 Tax=Ktedonobacter racemifer DSM 44963 TaxID=485913 RepID=D6TD23_KTERA|nr:ornithine cyclodeaminase family protein [Ktedonobacter racemifer]EFH90074.1 Ornithine cyclodeaminase [Ktedonobacter racemifer DSM 44963]